MTLNTANVLMLNFTLHEEFLQIDFYFLSLELKFCVSCYSLMLLTTNNYIITPENRCHVIGIQILLSCLVYFQYQVM